MNYKNLYILFSTNHDDLYFKNRKYHKKSQSKNLKNLYLKIIISEKDLPKKIFAIG